MTVLNVSVMQQDLADGLNDVSKAIDARPILPIMSHVYLEAYDGGLRLTGTNNKETITVAIAAKVNQTGVAAVPAKVFQGLVGLMSKESLNLWMNNETSTLTLQGGSSVSQIKGESASDFPQSKVSNSPDYICLPGAVFKQIVAETAFAAAKEDNRPALTGVLVRVSETKRSVTFAAADGYRLSVRECKILEEYAKLKQGEFLIPRQMMVDMAQILDEDEDVKIFYPGKNKMVTLHQDSCQISAQMIESRFPDFDAIVPRRKTTTITVDRIEWLKKCGVAEVFARDDSNSVKMAAGASKKDGTGAFLAFSGQSAERGSATTKVDVAMEGEILDVSLDIRFVMEALAALKDETVVLTGNGSDYPVVIRAHGREDFTHVLMPMTR